MLVFYGCIKNYHKLEFITHSFMDEDFWHSLAGSFAWDIIRLKSRCQPDGAVISSEAKDPFPNSLRLLAEFVFLKL